ncbi:MAG: hypothetical protein KAV87_12645 [Desulfobacteraceae bacterium]|nr:hypothetical protein [Desulfobacteraceae bacterium]
MARTVLTVQDILRTALTPSFVAGDATDNHSFDNTGHNVFIYVKTTGTAATLTVITPNTVDGLAVADLAITLPATGERIIGPFPRALYDTIDTDPDPDIDPAIFVDLDSETGLTLAAIRLPNPSY